MAAFSSTVFLGQVFLIFILDSLGIRVRRVGWLIIYSNNMVMVAVLALWAGGAFLQMEA